jgi:hypothetical protein
MKIEPHKQYAKLLPIWEKCRVTVEGDDSLKAWDEIQTVAPKLSNQQAPEYKAMIGRATLFNASGRTVDGLVGMVTRKPVDVSKMPSLFRPVLEDLTLAKDSKVGIDDFVAEALYEDLVIGRVGYLIERPNVNSAGMTQAQVAALNLRPYVAEYKAESIIDWRHDRVNNAAQLVMVRLTEVVEEWIGDIERKEIEQERRLLLVDGVYLQRIYREDGKGTLQQYGDDIIPLMNGSPLNYIPFICDFETTRPPILDLVNINLSHFRTDVDLEHGAHFTAIPTPMFAGFEFDTDSPFCLGASGGHAAQNPDAKAWFLEFEGKGLDTLKEIKEEKKAQMSVLGARFLDAEKNQAEATDTVRIRKSGETSVLAATAQKCARSITRILEIMRDWMGIAGDVTVELNTDYSDASLTPEQMTALFGMLQGGAISQQTFFYNMKYGEMYEPELTFEEEQSRIESQGLTLDPTLTP